MAALDSKFADLLIDAMAEGVFTLDAHGRITLWNRAMEQISGYTEDEVLGNSCSILNFNRCLNRECPSGVLDCGIFKHGRVDAKECLIKHKDGRDVPVVKSARVVKDKQARVVGVVETITDMSAIKEAEHQMAEAARRLGEVHCLGNILGKSEAMQRVFRAIEAAASSEATVLIEGESGTGKELVAGAIHYNGDRSTRPMVTVNCSALSESLLESELFGHVAGAFTGAVRNRIGRFEEAHGGTVFLDEIGEITPFIQVKLLRVLQQRTIERVGESKTRTVDIRIIAATNQDLLQRVRSGSFREDLYYRLKVFPIRIPPLRDRREDLPLLVDHFIHQQNLKTGKQIHVATPAAMRLLMEYLWPGNVRELENAIEHAFVLAVGNRIHVPELPVEIRSPVAAIPPPITLAGYAESRKRTKLSRERLVAELRACQWNKAEAARRLGYSRTAVWKYMKRWNIPLQPE
jgi:two-component system response regulator HydG